jgi:hypothetical protein
VVDARGPGTVIGLVVLGPKWLQAEARTHKALRNDKVIRYERLNHTARLRPDARQAVLHLRPEPAMSLAPAPAQNRATRGKCASTVIAFVFGARSGRTSALATEDASAGADADEWFATKAVARRAAARNEYNSDGRDRPPLWAGSRAALAPKTRGQGPRPPDGLGSVPAEGRGDVGEDVLDDVSVVFDAELVGHGQQ